MIFCYSASQKSKVYADVLSDILSRPVYMLECDIDHKRISHVIKSLWLAVTSKPAAVLNMPSFDNNNDTDEFYICCPVWGGNPAPPIIYFLENAPVKGKKINMLLTAGTAHIKYKFKAEKMIQKYGAEAGCVEIFASDTEPDKDVIESHIRTLFLKE